MSAPIPPASMAVRLFLGGLPPGVTPEELAARFAPFGEVTECSVAPPKAYPGVDGAVNLFARKFGHVSLRPKDEAALHKCISAYNGCKWRGGVLKCSLARQRYAERLAAERAGGGGGGDAAPAAAVELPPLGPGTTLRLRPPKSAGPVEVTLGSGARLDRFPETEGTARTAAPAAAWEPLEAPPGCGYRFEALLQRVAAAPPPELLAAVEARRARGQVLARARELAQQEAAGVEVAHRYSDDDGEPGGSLQLESDDDAGTAAAAVAAAVTARERRMAAQPGGSAAAHGPAAKKQRLQQQQQQQQRQQQDRGARLGTIDFLGSGPGQPAAGPPAAGAAADLSRFDSDSDAEWAGLPATGPVRLRQQPAKQQPPAEQPAKQARQASPPREPEPAGSSGSSGGSELEEFLAGAGAGSSEASSGGTGSPPASSGEDEGWQSGDAGMDDAGAAGGSESEQPEVSDGSSGGSELEEWLAQEEGGARPSSSPQPQSPEPASSEERAQLQPQPQPQRQRQQAQQAQQRGVVVFDDGEQAGGRLWRQKPAPAGDLSRFASSSDDDEAPPAQRQPQQPRQRPPQQQGTKRQRQERLIPQVDGAADSSSEEESDDASSSSSSSSEEDDEEESSSDASEGSEGAPKAATTGGGGSSKEDASSSDDESSSSGSSSEEDEEEAAAAPGSQQQQRAAGRGSESSGSESDEDAAGAAAAAAAAEEQRRQAALAALFPEGAAFRRSEPLAQIEATWRVSQEAWAKDFRQKHRQAVRLLGRASGGGGKRQRKG